MPCRLLREGILDSEAVNALDFPAEVFYRRLMSAVDDYGRFDARPGVLRSRLYPLKVDTVREADISRWIAACEKAGLIALYAIDGRKYLLMHKLGSPRAAKSKYPEPSAGTHLKADENGCAQRHAPESTCAQVKTDAPYSGSGSGSGASANTRGGNTPPNPPAGFDRFWAAYPRHTEKQKAVRAFGKLAPDETLLGVILAAIADQRAWPQWCKDDGQYIPHPATWLNGRRWEDQPTAATGPAPVPRSKSEAATGNLVRPILTAHAHGGGDDDFGPCDGEF